MSNKLPTRLRAIKLYKELYRIGKDYPNPSYDFHGKLRRAFEKNRTAQGEGAERAFRLGEYIKQETLALYSLRKYRHLKNAYYSDEGVKASSVPTLEKESGKE
ncbi:hypothetical protein M408DRAFT_72981 [Serendipita vermifera MAFF 305830]|uniref:Uncharacterized protein n=1 Tax=Serendipita vermifera MAFF 305830 TaxID=933852 RepID=A0A0C2XAQ3_SERVB|nr:hypothetical protein M408DRAFT_72981 [Serendipita vermifera MAFF 305830]